MINLFNVEIESLSLHRVGNKSRNEKCTLSERPYRPSQEMMPLLKEYFLKPFREKEELYFKFAHEVDLEYNSVYKYAKDIFNFPNHSHVNSKYLTAHLFDQSNHPHIKGGEVYVVHFTGAQIDGVVVDAVGIFKSEIMRDFLQFSDRGSSIEMILQQGVSLSKLDKGALIFNHKADEGYKVLCIDSNRYDARYWIEHFLSLDVFEDENFLTRKYLKFCQGFAKDVVFPSEDKKEQVMFMNRSVNYFAKNDQFEESNFLNEVLDNPDLIPEFKNYKVDKGQKYNVEDIMTFPIAAPAVSEIRRSIKNVINLDTNIQIKMDFINPESAEKFIEKGWDEEKQMYYYLVYFNKENKS